MDFTFSIDAGMSGLSHAPSERGVPNPQEARDFGGYASGPSFGMGATLPAPVLSGVAVTPETALTFTAYFAALNARSGDLAALPRYVKREKADGSKVRVRNDPRYNLVYCEPNVKTTAKRFFHALYAHKLGYGNGYAEIKRLKGMPVELLLHSPRDNDTWPEISKKSGMLWYQVDGGRRQIRGEDMIHLADLGWNGLKGFSVVTLHRQAIGYGLATEQFGAAFYGNAMTPRGVLKFKKSLSPEALRNLRESYSFIHQDTTNAHRLLLLEEDAEYVPMSVTPRDAEYLATRQFEAVEMCRILQVPPPRIMDYTGVTGVYKAFQDLIDSYIMFTLGPDAEGVEQEFNRKLFTARERAHGLHVCHDFKALMKGNHAVRMAYLKGRFETGSITPDEIRLSEGDNPTDTVNGKRFYLSKSYLPLDKADDAAVNPASKPAAKETEDDDASKSAA
jgi:HK97 family phage portal protein